MPTINRRKLLSGSAATGASLMAASSGLGAVSKLMEPSQRPRDFVFAALPQLKAY